MAWRFGHDERRQRVQLSISKTVEKIMPARLIDPAPPRASELPADPSFCRSRAIS
jgi:hypothetical protein